jgi:hypothetical protein
MITDCVPFAVWISLLSSVLITVFFAIRQDWFDYYVSKEGFLLLVGSATIALSMVLATIPVGIRSEKICVLIKNLETESFAFDLQSKKFICSFPLCDSRTNGIYEILAQRKVGFTGSGVSSEINYYIPLK